MQRKVPRKKLIKAANLWLQNKADDTYFTKKNGFKVDISGTSVIVYDTLSAYLIAAPFNVKPEVKSYFYNCFLMGYIDGLNADFKRIGFPSILKIPDRKSDQIKLANSTLQEYIKKNKTFPFYLNKKTLHNKGYINGVITKCKTFLHDNEMQGKLRFEQNGKINNKPLALKIFLLNKLGRIKDMPRCTQNKEELTKYFDDNCNASGDSIYNNFIKIFNSEGAKGYCQKHIEELEAYIEGDEELTNLLFDYARKLPFS